MGTVAAPSRPIGRYEQLAYERADRWHVAPPVPGAYFDEDAADRVVQFLEHFCRHHKGRWAGQLLELADWQAFCTREAFGWMRADGTRLIRTVYIEIPRKQGKSTWAGGIGLYLTVADGEPGAEVYSTATKEEQAKIVWGTARAMVMRSPELRDVVTLRQKRIVCGELDSWYAPLGADSDTLDGLNTHGHIADELHAHKDPHLWEVLDTSMGARSQPLSWIITTAGIYDPASIGWQIHEKATKILEGTFEDPTFFAFVTCADKDDDWRAPATWRKANPNIGISVSEEYLAEQVRKAEQQPSFLGTFQRYYLNVWGQTAETWIAPDRWAACAGPVEAQSAEIEDLAGRAGVVGLDLAAKLDLVSLSYLLPAADDTFDLVVRSWLPEARFRERVQQDGGHWEAWRDAGWLLIAGDEVQDYAAIRAQLAADAELLRLPRVGLDPWNAATLTGELQADGLEVIEVPQTMAALSEPSKELEALIMAGRIRHRGNPLLAWMIGNAMIIRDTKGNIMPSKKHSRGNIDGVAATLNALHLHLRDPREAASVYESRGVRSV